MSDSIFRIVFGANTPIYVEWLKIAAQAILQAAVAVGIFFLGIRYERRQTRRGEEKKLSNLRRILKLELAENYTKLIKAMPKEQDDHSKTWFTACALSELEYSIYTEYLGNLCDLEPEQMIHVARAYRVIQSFGAMAKRHLEEYPQPDQLPTASDVERMVNISELTAEAIRQAMRTFKSGEDFLKREEGERAKNIVQMSDGTPLTAEQIRRKAETFKQNEGFD